MKNLDPPENGPPSPDVSKYLDPHGTNISEIGWTPNEIFGPPFTNGK